MQFGYGAYLVWRVTPSSPAEAARLSAINPRMLPRDMRMDLDTMEGVESLVFVMCSPYDTCTSPPFGADIPLFLGDDVSPRDDDPRPCRRIIIVDGDDDDDN